MRGVASVTITLSFLAIWITYGLSPKETTPEGVGGIDVRLWDALLSRRIHPIGILWFWGIVMGKGFTANLF